MIATVFALFVVGGILYAGWLLAGGPGVLLALIGANAVGAAFVNHIRYRELREL